MQKMRQLFRQEAIDAQREKLLGAVSSARPVPLRVFTAIAAAFAITLIVFSFWGEYTRRERVEGILVLDGVARLLAPEAGVIKEVYVKEGAEVRAETLIAKFLPASGRIGDDAKQLEAQRKRLLDEIASVTEQTKQQEEQLRNKVSGLRNEIEQATTEIDLGELRVTSARREVDRTAELVKNGFVSESVLIQKRNELVDQQVKVQNSRRTRSALERDLGSARADLNSSEMKRRQAIGPLERKISEIDAMLSKDVDRKEQKIFAPFPGVVTNIAVNSGDSLAADSLIATILPQGASLRAQLLVPTRASGFIAPGNTVVMRYDAFPFQRFGQYHGHVDQVSGTVWSPGEKVGTMTVREPVYRVDVKLDQQKVMASGQAMSLRPGMTLSADILLERRTVFEWIFEPVLELRGRL